MGPQKQRSMHSLSSRAVKRTCDSCWYRSYLFLVSHPVMISVALILWLMVI